MSVDNNSFESESPKMSEESHTPSYSDVKVQPPAELASLLQRFFGSMIDGFVTAAVLLPVAIKLDLLHHPETVQTQAIVFLLSFLAIVIINGYLLYTKGQSVGKMVVGTQIIGLDGRLLSLERIVFLRYMPLQIVAQIPVIGQVIAIIDALMIFNEDRRCLHDLIAGTVVVAYDPEREHLNR
jgi:uncharacterized RDD family membrane protein YckC